MTAQNPGLDGSWNTADDELEPLNQAPLNISIDTSFSPLDTTNPMDRVRGFYSYHPRGANFVFADGSVRYLNESINSRTYRHLSTIKGGETISDD
ncbi:MAG: DUF1559 domain-containing protein [Mariniblastus sp.]|nr:DUF1559 domain-containing protein [Mariniblastus sp.]